MPCQDSSANMIIKLNNDDHLDYFYFTKLACGSPIDAQTGFQDYCKGKKALEILDFDFSGIVNELGLENEEQQFILYLEWDALRASLAAFFGIEKDTIDAERCRITSIKHDEDGILISEIVLPPRDLPDLIPCHLRSD